jgi:hypothetical protein
MKCTCARAYCVIMLRFNMNGNCEVPRTGSTEFKETLCCDLETVHSSVLPDMTPIQSR